MKQNALKYIYITSLTAFLTSSNALLLNKTENNNNISTNLKSSLLNQRKTSLRSHLGNHTSILQSNKRIFLSSSTKKPIQAKCYDGNGPCLPVSDSSSWLNTMNKYLQRASSDVLKLRIFSKIGVKKYKRFLPGQLEFYRTEFEFCDEDSNGFVSFEENVKCQKLAEDLIKSQLKRQGWAKVPDVLFSINITKLNREVQKTTGLNFDQYGKLKIFLAMIWGRALFKKHDSYGGMKNNYVCIGEWSDTQAYLRTLFSGYTQKIAMNHFGEFDYDRSGALEEIELYYLFDHLWYRWFSTKGENIY